MQDSFLSRWERIIKGAPKLYENMANSSPQMSRGQVWCHKCGHTQKVDSGECLRSGWPLHCGETMSIDSPEERASRSKR